MPIIAIINRKGGSGKSTLATHLAAWLARSGRRVMLGDVDRQQSTVAWLNRRAHSTLPLAPVVGWAMDPKRVLRPPIGVTHAVLDTPGGLHGYELNRLLAQADVVLVPVCDAFFDRSSAADCLQEIRQHPRVAAGRVKLAVIGMRIDVRAAASSSFVDWAAAQAVPVVGLLRTSRAYVHCADQGLTVFDLPATKAAVDLEQWQPITRWLDQALLEVTASASAHRAHRPVSAARSADASAARSRPSNISTAALGVAVPATVPRGIRRWFGWLFAQPAAVPARPGA